MFGVAFVHAPGREEQVPSEMMTLRQERGQSFLSASRWAASSCSSAPGISSRMRSADANPIRVGAFGSRSQIERQGFPKRRRRFPRSPEFQTNPRLEERQLRAINVVTAKSESGLREVEGLRGTVSSEPVFGRPPVRRCSLRGPCLFQVDGVKERVAILEPFRGPSVQRLSCFAEERSVRGVPDQSVSECDFRAARAQHSGAREARQIQLASANDVSEGVGIKTLAKGRSRLKWPPCPVPQSVNAGQDQPPEGGGQVGAEKFLGVAQQLIEKQRIAGGAREATPANVFGRVDSLGELLRLIWTQRAKIQSDERRSTRRVAQRRIESLVVRPRRRQNRKGVIIGDVEQRKIAPVSSLSAQCASSITRRSGSLRALRRTNAFTTSLRRAVRRASDIASTRER